jgi:hypothetical protein
MGVEAAGAVGAEQMSHAHRRLAQDQFQVAALAFGADFTDAAERQYVKGLAFIVDMVDYHARVELAENQTIFRFRVVTARWGGFLLR